MLHCTAAIPVLSYLLGSIPFGYILIRVFQRRDIRAVGSGRVVSAGAKGANGKMVHLRHPNGYETRYLHLSRIAVKAGASVAQGDLIGYVGSSGLSTGPHLDFRIQRFGKPLNPLTLIFPPGEPVPAEKMEQFAAVRDAWMGRLLPR